MCSCCCPDFEGLPLSLLEAMGEGVVPVVSDLESGVREVVTETTGVRVPVGDVAAAAAAIAGLARDPARWERLSGEGRRLAREEYSAARMAERYVNLVATFPEASPIWPERVIVPPPQLVRAKWRFAGLPRLLRRWLNKYLGLSSPCPRRRWGVSTTRTCPAQGDIRVAPPGI